VAVGRIKTVSTKAVKYGPQIALVWKYAAVPVTAAAQRAFAAQLNRRTALRHAETVNGGAILMVMDQGEVHWVVFSGGKPVAAYPSSDKPLDDLIADANLSKKMTPDQFRIRQAEASRRQKALDTARSLSTQLRRHDDGM
jgi:hypothetical protein